MTPFFADGARRRSSYQYKRNRYYDPSTGRFTQEDPIGLAGGLNLYGFTGGDPVNYSDPFGLCSAEDKKAGNCTQEDLGPSEIPSLWDRQLAYLKKSPATQFAMGMEGGTAEVGAASGIQNIVNGLVQRFGQPAIRALEKGITQLEFKLPNGVKMIIRGPETHPITAGGDAVTHYNVEVQKPTGKPGRFKTIENTHLDENGKVINQ